MKNFLSIIAILLMSFFCKNLIGQNAPDFTVTDSNGIVHELYADYLDEGKTVVIKFFFVACPPCRAMAPRVQELYEDWGSGDKDVEFFEISISNQDDNVRINGYKNDLGLTFPAIGSEGGASGVIAPYQSGEFGSFSGTPSFAVIAPDRSVLYNTGGGSFDSRKEKLHEAILATGASGFNGNQALPSVFDFSITTNFNTTDDQVIVTLGDRDNLGVNYVIDSESLSIVNFNDYPGIENPVLRFERQGNVKENVTALDMLLLRKHLLSLIPITDPDMVKAADVNGDEMLTAVDLLNMRKLILNILPEFAVPTYQLIPDEVPISLLPGETQQINVKVIKTGDLNGF